MRKLILFVVLIGLISCEKNDSDNNPAPKWELVSEMSNRYLLAGKVLNDNLILMSNDSILTYNTSNRIINSRLIPGRKSIGTHSPFRFDNSDLIGLPTYFPNNPGRLDSLAINIYKLNSDLNTTIEYTQIPEIDTKGYVTPVNTGCCREVEYNFMSNYDNRLSVLLVGWDKSDSSSMDNSDNYYRILRINITQSSNLTSIVDKIIGIQELPFFESFSKYDLISFKNFDFVVTSDGTYVISENGFHSKLESTQAMFKYSDKLYQLRANSLYVSNDGLTWNKKVDISIEVDWSLTTKAVLIENTLIDYGWTGWLKKSNILTGESELITHEGLPDSDCSFIIDFNNYLYLGLDNGLVYRIEKNKVIDN